MKFQWRLWLLGGVILAGVLWAYQQHGASSFEQRYYDFLFQSRQVFSPVKNITNSDIVLVTIDDESLEWIGSWPWPRSYHAKVIEALNQHGASLIGFDVVFDSPQSLGEHEDLKFSKAIQVAQNVFLASMFNYRKSEQGRIESYRRPIAEFLFKARGVGFTNPLPDSDGSIRRAQLITYQEGKRYPSFVLSLYKARQNIRGNVAIHENFLSLGDTQVSFDKEGAFKINFAGPAGYFKRIPFNQILDGSYFKRDPSAVAGKIVLIGATSPILQDIFSNPFSKQKSMPGVEVQANELHTLLTQKFIREFPAWLNALGLVASCGILFLILLRFKGWLGLSLAILWSAFMVIVNIVGFMRFRIYVDALPYFLLALPLYFVLTATWQYFVENKEKNFIARIFRKYMDSHVVDQVLQQRGELSGDKRELTVLFCDIKGFTRFSEAQPPEEVVKALNRFLEKMTNLIAKYQGTVDKYMGDSVMAFWGAPQLLENHAMLAVQAGFEMLKNQELQGFAVSVGINTGPMIVGNIGSAKHMSYTVIGDAVNTAARLQSIDLPNHSASQLIISEATYRLVHKNVQARELGTLTLKGKAQGVRAYEVLGWKS